MKAIIIGASLSGKTTLIRHVRLISHQHISEMDEELTTINGGTFPNNSEYKHNVLAPQVIEKILGEDSIIFFTNTDYFSEEDLKLAHERDFVVLQLEVDINTLNDRNERRAQQEGYVDQSQWLEGMVRYQERIRKQGLVDGIIRTDQPVESIGKDLLKAFPEIMNLSHKPKDSKER